MSKIKKYRVLSRNKEPLDIEASNAAFAVRLYCLVKGIIIHTFEEVSKNCDYNVWCENNDVVTHRFFVS